MKKILETLKSKWAEYLLEGIVIVVGIIGAFMLDAWKEERNLREREIQLLKELREDLLQTEGAFKTSIDSDLNRIQSRRMIIMAIEEELPWNDSLIQHFDRFLWWDGYYFRRSAFNSIENWGLNNLSNDSLRVKISGVYNETERYSEDLTKLVWTGSFQEEFWKTSTTQLKWSGFTSQPVNYQEFIQNKEFAFQLRYLHSMSTLAVQQRQNMVIEVRDLIENLNLEITRLQEL